MWELAQPERTKGKFIMSSLTKRIPENAFQTRTMSEKTNGSENRQNVFDIFDQMANNFLDNFFDPANQKSLKDVVRTSSYPKIDVFIKDDKYHIEASVPGMTSDSLNVEVRSVETQDPVFALKDVYKLLEITGTSQTLTEGTEWIKRELKRSAFSKSFILPENLIEHPNEPDVVLKNGILSISWNLIKTKQEPKMVPKKIPIKTE